MVTRIARFVLLASVLAILLAACGPTPTPTVPVAPAAAQPAVFPMTITDSAGRSVTVESAPQRIVSLVPSLTEDLFAVGAGDQVIGDTTYCNYPPEAATREKIGGYSAKTINIEKIVALKPDLVFAEAGVHDDIITALGPLGITVVGLKATTFDQVYGSLELLE
jgi:iron complex transport system substrate-binding protein